MTSSEFSLPADCDVAIIGGGCSGLALAAELKRRGIDNIAVLEREAQAGGIPRHCGHRSFGIREYGRLLTGPDYARRNVDTALQLGVAIYTQTTVTELLPRGVLKLCTPAGTTTLNAARIVLCTGVRESSRAQRLIGGERPSGVLSTGALQNLVYLKRMRPFHRPVILGSELVSMSAIETCRHLNIRPVAMVESRERIIARRLFELYLKLRNVPLITHANELRIVGRDRVICVSYVDESGTPGQIETDGVIVSGRFRPESALLRQSHIELDSGTGGPVIDQYGQCSDPAYYCAGNLLRAAETSAWCWLEGIHSAQRIAKDLIEHDHRQQSSVRLKIGDPAIQFALPQRLTLSDRPNPMQHIQIGLREPVKGIIKATVGGQQIWRGRINSRPVRRVLIPLSGILGSHPVADVELSISRR